MIRAVAIRDFLSEYEVLPDTTVISDAGRVPSRKLLSLLSDLNTVLLPDKPKEEFIVTDDTGSRRHMVGVGKLHWKIDGSVEIEVSRYVHPLNAYGYKCRLRKVNGQWKVVDKDLGWIS